MANNYILDFVTSGTPNELPGKSQITILEKTIDGTSTSLKLFGKGAPNYGEGQQEDFLKMLENFASETAPANATIGQLWWKVYPTGDTRRPILMVCDALSHWIPVNDPMIRVAYNYEYNQMVDLYKLIVGTQTIGTNCSDTFGWGQTTLANSVSKKFLPAEPVTNADWVFLLNKWKEVSSIVGVDQALFESDGFIIEDHLHIEEGPPLGVTGEAKGIATIIGEYERAKNAYQEIFANRFNFGIPYLELSNLLTVDRATYWTDETYLTVQFKWTDNTAMNLFFLTGGYLKLIPSLNSPVSDNTTNMWVRLITGLGGGILIKGCATVDQTNNTRFSSATSLFNELPDSTVSWPVSAAQGSIGKVLYKANEYEINSNTGELTYNGLGGYGGYSIDDLGNDSDIGWADITVEARKDTATGTLEVRIAFDNETASQVKGLLSCNITSFKAGASWGTITPSPAPTHPTILGTPAFI